MSWNPSLLPYNVELETKPVLKALNSAHRAVAELKGVAGMIPRQEILINSLVWQEAKDSSEVENIVTTHDELYKASVGIDKGLTPATKEVKNYVAALKRGFEIVSKHKLLTNNHILEVQAVLEENSAGFRKLPGTTLKNDKTGDVVYTPPQHYDEILGLMSNLERFINDPEMSNLDPIVKMAVIHFQFESIHPFYDGNGRTGRIINILYLVQQGLIDLPILYLSRFIIRRKPDYYRLLQAVRESADWESWILFMIYGVENTALNTQLKVHRIRLAMMEYKERLRNQYKFYSHELINHLFQQPYTRIEYVQEALGLKSRQTAAAYLNELAKGELLIKVEGRPNYYINPYLLKALKDE